MRIKRCAILMIEPRENRQFSLESLCNGGDGIDAQIELFALAPHLDGEVRIDPAEIEILTALTAAHWLEFDVAAVRFDESRLHDLLAKGLLLGDDEAHAEVRARDLVLRDAHWHAHSAVSHYLGRWRGVTSGEDGVNASLCSMADLAKRLGPPPAHSIDRVTPELRLALPAIEPTPLDDMLACRATCRNFAAQVKINKYTFAHLLHRVFAAQAEYEIHPGNTVIKRTSPSGGGLHPIDAYLLVQHVEGVEPGLYHYHSTSHALEPLPAPVGELKTLARTMVAAQEYYVEAAVMVVLVARFPRTFWKYRSHSKAYRVTILDAGHLSQTLYLSATEFGLGAFITAAINEVDIEQAFGLDPLIESPLAVCGFGRRGSECATFEFDPNRAVWPDGVALPE